jgi:hypothetical protein
VLLAASARSVAQETVVTKVAEGFDEAPWIPDQWSSARGSATISAERAPDAGAGRCMEMEVRFSGEGFEHFGVCPPRPLVIPGDVRTITLRTRVADGRYALRMTFVDGWGRDKVDGKALEWDLPRDPNGAWKTTTFKVPEAWVRPVRIVAIGTHNWGQQSAKNAVRFWFDDMEVQTDLRDVDPATGALKTWRPQPNPPDPAKAMKECPKTPLLSVDFSTGQECNVFSREEPSAVVRIRNWKPGAITGKIAFKVLDDPGKTISQGEQAVSVDSAAGVTVPLKVERFGRYAVQADLSLSDGTTRSEKMVFARVPPYPELTDRQKQESPYGLNVHSGGRVCLIPFKKAGIVWFREYCFTYEWLLRAKGADRKYAGWPYYPKIVQAYAEANVVLLPVLMKSISRPALRDGRVVEPVGPDAAWRQEIAGVILGFPQITQWELDNEYDYPKENVDAEQRMDWRNYRAYHKAFGDILEVLGGGKYLAVENGRAGIWPERAQACVRSGDFDRIGVVNVHHYCGVEPPETNIANFNTGLVQGEPEPALFYDLLRRAKQAAQSDGKKRQVWLTELGWDTLAGYVVTPQEQAVYLQRGFMTSLAAGMDKAFWFYNFDAAEPKVFFDGCGLLAANGEPKLSLCAMAGLASVLPQPRCVGSIEAGPNTAGYVFQNEGKLVAALWSIQGDGPKVEFQADQLFDYLGNKIDGKSVTLSPAPVYAVGLSKADRFYRQAAYSLETPHMEVAAAGDTLRPLVRVTNNRAEPIQCKVSIAPPEGWQAQRPEAAATVPPGATQDVELPFTVSLAEKLGLREVAIRVSEGAALKEIPLKVLVHPAVALQVSPLEGRPGKTTVTVKVANRSTKTLGGTIRLSVPQSWKAASPATEIKDLKPGQSRDVPFELEWATDWKPRESARVELDLGSGSVVSQPLIPGQYRLRAAKDIKLDGRLEDWPEDRQFPTWLLGSTVGEPQAKVYLAWAKEGIYGAVEVHDSKVLDKDPRNFWAGDVLELFIDTRDDKRPRQYEAGDHQFWLVPMVGENRVYLGQWKRGSEVQATRYDIPGVKGAAVKTADGYVMEFLLPAELIQKYQPAAGGRLGLCVNLTVQGKRFIREVYWPRSKASGAPTRPETWGTVDLVE